MTPELMALLLDHATGTTPWTAPAQWYLAYFLDGTEITGGSYAREPIDFAAAEEISETHVRAGSSNLQEFDNLPTADTDELRIVNTASGAITLTGWIIPHVRSFTSGDGKVYGVDKIGVNLSTS